MTTEFDTITPRSGTDCIKWDFGHGDGHGDGDMVPWDRTHPDQGRAQLLPMSLADMEFKCPEPVIAALAERASHGIFSYSLAGESFYEALIEWIDRRHHWLVDRDWIVAANGVVPTLSLLVRELTAPTDAVIIQQPVFGPFARAVEANGRRLISNDLIEHDRAYEMDFEDLAGKAADPAANMLILCNPHNPIGKVWGKADLKRLGEICLSHGVLVIADELHCDLLFDGVSFTPFASIGADFAANSVTCMAASKSFNLAGLHLSATIIPDADRRAAFKTAERAAGTFDDNLFGLVATEAAFRYGEPWLAQVMAYIQDNYRFMVDHLARHTPEITVTPAEATYLMWLDCRRLGLDGPAVDRLMLEEARLIVGSGTDFGDTGSGFVRLNIACPRAQLAEALDRLAQAVGKIRPSLAYAVDRAYSWGHTNEDLAMTFEDILYDTQDAIATITLNRPDKLNAWTRRMEYDVRNALSAATEDDGVRVIILTGAGRGYCAGADMDLLSGISNKSSDGPSFETNVGAMDNGLDLPDDFSRRNTFYPTVPKPVIAAINGPCAGLGMVLSLYADMRFAAESAIFTTAFAQRGLIAEHGVSWMLPKLVGHAAALDLLLSARKVTAAEALAIGLVNDVFADTSFMDDVRAYANRLATTVSPRSMRVMKEQVYNAAFQDLGEATAAADKEMVKSFDSEDFKEGVAHYVEKRAPAFTGR